WFFVATVWRLKRRYVMRTINWAESLTYIKTVVDIVREPVIILDEEFVVVAANETFYRTFLVDKKETEGRSIYRLGDGQWNIPALRKLLEEILPNNTFFKGFEVAREFPVIGRKIMILNGRRIYPKEGVSSKAFLPIIMLAMEDITEMMVVAETLALHSNQLESKLVSETRRLEFHIRNLGKEISQLKIKKKISPKK
ncbi:MAG: PAS domain-containing protein, partial [Parcubacteria group bacterium]